MLHKTIKFIIHPIFVYAVIACLECIPYGSSLDKKIYHEMPKVGDNFGTVESEAIFYYSGKGKYAYPNPECFLGSGNPPANTRYEDGGVKIITQEIADQIPMLGSMCDDQKQQTEPVIPNERNTFINQATSTNYLLDHFSNVSHFMTYFIFSLSILFHRRKYKSNYWLVFGICFLGGALLEGVQHFFIPGRKAQLDDQLLNSVGALLGMLFFLVLKRTKIYQKYAVAF